MWQCACSPQTPLQKPSRTWRPLHNWWCPLVPPCSPSCQNYLYQPHCCLQRQIPHPDCTLKHVNLVATHQRCLASYPATDSVLCLVTSKNVTCHPRIRSKGDPRCGAGYSCFCQLSSLALVFVGLCAWSAWHAAKHPVLELLPLYRVCMACMCCSTQIGLIRAGIVHRFVWHTTNTITRLIAVEIDGLLQLCNSTVTALLQALLHTLYPFHSGQSCIRA